MTTRIQAKYDAVGSLDVVELFSQTDEGASMPASPHPFRAGTVKYLENIVVSSMKIE